MLTYDLLGEQGAPVRSDLTPSRYIHYWPLNVSKVLGREQYNKEASSVLVFIGDKHKKVTATAEQHGRFSFRVLEGDIWVCKRSIWYTELTAEELVSLFSWFHLKWPPNTTSDWLTFINREATERNIIAYTVKVMDCTSGFLGNSDAATTAYGEMLEYLDWLEGVSKANNTALQKREWLRGMGDMLTHFKAWPNVESYNQFWTRFNKV